MEKANYFIEWLGILLLSIEAIKLENFKKLTDVFLKLKIALNSRYIYIDGETYIEVPSKKYKWVRKYSNLILLFIGYSIIAFSLAITNTWDNSWGLLKEYIFVFINVRWYRILLEILAIITIFLAIPFWIGNEFVRYFSIFAYRYPRLLAKLEKNTFNGIVGILGFSLISISLLIKVILSK
jgi:hypothetical protein